jgi:hypothetical protein
MLPDQNAVYYPEELSLLGQILDQAVQSLPLSMRTPQNRAAIAKNILACAATGERDPIELRLAALINLKVTGVTGRRSSSYYDLLPVADTHGCATSRTNG